MAHTSPAAPQTSSGILRARAPMELARKSVAADQRKYVNSSGYDLEPGWRFFPISAVSGSLTLGLQEHPCD
jgi:hypothetical protein